MGTVIDVNFSVSVSSFLRFEGPLRVVASEPRCVRAIACARPDSSRSLAACCSGLKYLDQVASFDVAHERDLFRDRVQKITTRLTELPIAINRCR